MLRWSVAIYRSKATLVTGDAVCSFNPIYGQGMSVAATGIADLAKRFYARARRIVDIPWLIATGEDLRSPQVEGPRPPGSLALSQAAVYEAAALFEPEAAR